MFIFSLISFLAFTVIAFILLSKKLALRMKFYHSRQDLLMIRLESSTYYLIDLKQPQEENVDFFYKAAKKIEKDKRYPVRLCWLDETKIDDYTSILESLNLTCLPSLLFCNDQGGIEHEDTLNLF